MAHYNSYSLFDSCFFTRITEVILWLIRASKARLFEGLHSLALQTNRAVQFFWIVRMW